MMGCDLRNVDETSLALMKNKGLLRINQDVECRTPFICGDNGKNGLCWFRHLSDNEYTLMFVNYGDKNAEITLDLDKIGLWDGCGHGLKIKDVFTGKTETVARTKTKRVDAHDGKTLNCIECGAELSKDEIALHKKLINRGASEHLCINCLAKRLDVTVALLEEKIKQFRAEGCTLFEEVKMRYLGVDYGDVRTGLAVCDKSETLASPVCTIKEYNEDRLI